MKNLIIALGYNLPMISTKHRFHGYGSLRRVYQSGQTVRGQNFSTKYLLNPKRSSYRLSIVVSRKVSKSAVTRNRIRRRLYEAVRILEEEIAGAFDIVIIVYSDSVIEEPAKELHGQVKRQLKSAGIIKPVKQ